MINIYTLSKYDLDKKLEEKFERIVRIERFDTPSKKQLWYQYLALLKRSYHLHHYGQYSYYEIMINEIVTTKLKIKNPWQ